MSARFQSLLGRSTRDSGRNVEDCVCLQAIALTGTPPKYPDQLIVQKSDIGATADTLKMLLVGRGSSQSFSVGSVDPSMKYQLLTSMDHIKTKMAGRRCSGRRVRASCIQKYYGQLSRGEQVSFTYSGIGDVS